MEDNEEKAIIKYLRLKQDISSLEKDILDTCDALYRNPFDFSAALRQVQMNNLMHPDADTFVRAKPTTVRKSMNDITEMDLRYNLKSQLDYLLMKELKELDKYKKM